MRYTARYKVFKPMLGRSVDFHANFRIDDESKRYIEVFDTNHFCAISRKRETLEEAHEDLSKIMRIGLPPFCYVIEANKQFEQQAQSAKES